MSQSNATDRPPPQAAPTRQLTLFDSTCIIVGIIIGAFFYETSPSIAKCAAGGAWLLHISPWEGMAFGIWMSEAAWLIGVWLLGGLLSLIGALCYAELATAYPKAGGDYVYLTRAFGRSLGFLFAWAQLWIVRPGSIGALAYVFGRYASRLFSIAEGTRGLMIYAVASILVLTAINVLGVREGKWTQNLLTTVKVLGLSGIFVVGLLLTSPDASSAGAAKTTGEVDFRLAMILILYTYGGWNEMAYVGAEVRNPKKNILRSLVLGTVAVTLIYVLATLAFLHGLGFAGTCNSEAVATDVLELGLGEWGGRLISVLICISALGAINGMIFTGARIYYAMGTEHRLYARLGRWSPRLGTPVWSLAIQAVITLALVIGFGLTEGGFDALVIFTTPVFWIFFLLVGISLFILRYREADTPRPYRVPWYPIVPVLFCLSSLFMVWASVSWAIDHRSWEAIWSIAILLVGVAFCFYDPRPTQPAATPPDAD